MLYICQGVNALALVVCVDRGLGNEGGSAGELVARGGDALEDVGVRDGRGVGVVDVVERLRPLRVARAEVAAGGVELGHEPPPARVEVPRGIDRRGARRELTGGDESRDDCKYASKYP